MRPTLATALALACIALLAACGGDPTPTPEPPDKAEGILTGRVTIGPLCPVEPCANPAPDVYSSRELLLTRDGEAPVVLPLADDGSFQALIPTGIYSVELSDCVFLGCGLSLPVVVTVTDGETATLAIDIDTGIRAPSGS